jgi:FlgD Ig-like domain
MNHVTPSRARMGNSRAGGAARNQVSGVALALWLVAALLLATIATPGTAMAADVTIQSPLAGGKYQSLYTGPFAVDFTGATPDTYTLTVSGANYSWEMDHVYDGENHSFSQPFDPIGEPGDYTAVVEDSSETEIASVAFRVLGTDDATITSPNQGQTFQAPFSGNVSVNWSSISDPDDNYRVEIDNGFTHKQCQYDGADLEDTTTHCSLSSARAGHYDAWVFNGTGEDLDHVSFNVDPRLTLTDVRVGPSTFYPLVRDGFRDTTTVRFRTNKDSRNRVHIMKGSRTLKRVELGNQSRGSHQWTWNGKDGAGRKVEPGFYKLQVIASASGETKKVARTVKAHTRVLRKNFSKSKRGTAFRSRGKRGNCNFDGLDGEALLTCLFGVAWTDYAFKMSPGSLRHIVRGPVVHGGGFRYRNGIVRCHAATDAKRRGRTLMMRFLSNGSNGWSQCWVVSARVKYHYLYQQ